MNEKARAAKNAYQREWYSRNRARSREYVKRYWERVAEKKTGPAGQEPSKPN